MSDPIAKAERSHAKDIRQGVVDQRPVGTKNKRDRPVVLQHRGHPDCNLSFIRDDKTWRTWGRYRNEQEAQKAMDGLIRKRPTLYEYRIEVEQ